MCAPGDRPRAQSRACCMRYGMLSCGCIPPGDVGGRRPSCPGAPGRHPAPAISSCGTAKQDNHQHWFCYQDRRSHARPLAPVCNLAQQMSHWQVEHNACPAASPQADNMVCPAAASRARHCRVLNCKLYQDGAYATAGGLECRANGPYAAELCKSTHRWACSAATSDARRGDVKRTVRTFLTCRWRSSPSAMLSPRSAAANGHADGSGSDSRPFCNLAPPPPPASSASLSDRCAPPPARAAFAASR